MPYFSFAIALYAQWLDNLAKTLRNFPDVPTFEWAPEGVKSKSDVE